MPTSKKNVESTNLPNQKQISLVIEEKKNPNNTIFEEESTKCVNNGAAVADAKLQDSKQSAATYDDDDWGIPVQKISYEEGLQLAHKQEMDKKSFFSLFSYGLLIIVIATLSSFYFYTGEVSGEAGATPVDVPSQAEIAIKYALSSFGGCIALLLPILLYTALARFHLATASAMRTFIDLVKAVVYKYAFMMFILWCIFKFTPVENVVCIFSFIAMLFTYMFLQIRFLLRQNQQK